MLYSIFLVCYFVWERRVARRRSAAKWKRNPQPKRQRKEDIMGKSGFDVRNSLPEATTLIKSEKRAENHSTFAVGNERPVPQRPPAAIPEDRLDEVFSSPKANYSDDVDFSFDDGSEDDEKERADGDIIDHEESDGDEAGGMAFSPMMATGVGFDELKGMAQTVNAPDAADATERVEAGRVLVEVRQTDMFEQLVSGRPEKRVTVGQLMDEFLSEWRRRQRETDERNEEPFEKAPGDFNPRQAFA